jgi:L-alanine-DL-glutamate epimerase-like enolase superfamily enzyme
MNRRLFLKSIAAASTTAVAGLPLAEAALPPAKITRVRIFQPPNLNQLFNQSNMLCTVETDAGLTGIGEGGSKDTLEQCAGSLIGKNPFQIETLWQRMYMEWFYPPGREKIDALGALDLALWDIKGKAFQAPVHQLLNGSERNYIECYPTGGVGGGGGGGGRGGGGRGAGAGATGAAGAPPNAGRGGGTSLKERAAATIAAGYKAYRIDGGIALSGNVFDVHERVREVAKACKEVREGVGENGNWSIDFHQKFDFPDALRLCRLIEDYEPYLVEDPTRDEQFLEDIPKLRKMTTCPLAAGEEWGQRWNFNPLVENHDLDYIRATLPNVGGITEMMKIAALCETHAIGIVPHFTGPVATAALANCLSTFPGPVLFEYNYGERPIDYLPECLDFKQGKLYTNDRPGLGVTLDLKLVKQIGEVTTPISRQVYTRPDGSLTHW